jgi:hypothetical protein
LSIFRVIALLTLAAALPVSATTIFANNPGALPGTAQNTVGLFPTELVGTLPDTTDPFAGVNMFQIQIFDPSMFSASVIGEPFGIADTVLSLFDSTGHGVMLNDDQGGGNINTLALSCLPSAVGNPCPSSLPAGVGPTIPGIYYLAISLASNYPTSTSGEMFSPSSTTDVVGPDLTMGGNDPITGWDGGAFTFAIPDDDNYDILLGGTIPEPATWMMTGAACLGLLLLRRIK